MELRCERSELLFLYLEHICTVRLISKCLIYIDIKLVSDLCAEELGLSIALYILHAYI